MSICLGHVEWQEEDVRSKPGRAGFHSSEARINVRSLYDMDKSDSFTKYSYRVRTFASRKNSKVGKP